MKKEGLTSRCHRCHCGIYFICVLHMSNRGQQSVCFSLSETSDSMCWKLSMCVYVCVLSSQAA